jgi:hypothetical protein
MIVLRISDNDGVNLKGVKLLSTTDVAQALEKISAENPDMAFSVDATDSKWYESIVKAIYGSHRAGFSGERFRVLIHGSLCKPDMKLRYSAACYWPKADDE